MINIPLDTFVKYKIGYPTPSKVNTGLLSGRIKGEAVIKNKRVFYRVNDSMVHEDRIVEFNEGHNRSHFLRQEWLRKAEMYFQICLKWRNLSLSHPFAERWSRVAMQKMGVCLLSAGVPV